MIWFFLAGWIAGAVAMIMLFVWLAKKHFDIIEIDESEDEDTND